MVQHNTVVNVARRAAVANGEIGPNSGLPKDIYKIHPIISRLKRSTAKDKNIEDIICFLSFTFITPMTYCPPYRRIYASVNLTDMGLLPDTQNCGLRMRLEYRERFPRHRLERKPLFSDPGMHHGTCVTHMPWCMSGSLTRGGGENSPGIPGACATYNLASGKTPIDSGRLFGAKPVPEPMRLVINNFIATKVQLIFEVWLYLRPSDTIKRYLYRINALENINWHEL